MGNAPGKQGKITDFKPLKYETLIFAAWTINDVKELLRRFRCQVFGFAMVEAQFEAIITFHEGVAKHVDIEELFDVLDNDSDGRIDGLELLGGLALCCQGSFEDKARFCFELFDFNLNASLSKKEMIMMMMSTVNGMNALSGGSSESEFSLEVFEKLADDAFSRADRNVDGAINYEEFVSWARSNRDMMQGIEKLNQLVGEALKHMDSDDSAEETDEGELSDAEPPAQPSSNPRKAGAVPGPTQGDEEGAPQNDEHWRLQCFEPTNFKKSKKEKEGPETNMELEWVFGVSSENIRNSCRYIVGELDHAKPKFIVYPVAAVAVVYDIESRSQAFYQSHTKEITAIALHPSGRRIATADAVGLILVWDAASLSTVYSIDGVVRSGYKLLEFSPTQDRLCAVGRDTDHTIAIYEVSTGSILQSGKVISQPSTVNGLAYSRSGAEIALVGKDTVVFLRGVGGKGRALDAQRGKIGKLGKKQTFFCVAYCDEDPIIGCASGELYRFRQGKCIEVIQAHGMKDPVLSIYFSPLDGCLITGGKDGLVKTWDPSLKEVGQPLDLAEDLDGDGQADNGSLNTTVTSVQLMGNHILAATKASEIFHAVMPSKPTSTIFLNKISCGHFIGELSGLATHPFLDEFVTSGDDKTLRTWDIRRHAEICCKSIPERSTAVAYSNSGDTICVGMSDGCVALVTSTALKALSLWNHCDKPITDLKFSPDDFFIAVACADSNIYLYKSDDKRNYRRQAVCRGHKAAVTHIDFSANGRYLQSNAGEGDNSILYWDMMGNMINSHILMRDTNWFTWTCTFGFPVQGIYPPNAPSSYVNTVHAVPEVGVLLSGDDNNSVNLFRYPSIHPGALRQSHIGHAGNVSQVRFSYNRRHAISIGGTDRAILVWAHELEFQESDDEYAVDSSATSSGSSLASNDSDVDGEAALRVKISKPNPAVKTNGVEPWKSCITEPTDWLQKVTRTNRYYTPTSSTDVDFGLDRLHGSRLFDTRGGVRYTASGTIAYFTASSCIIYNRATETQHIMHGSHSGPVIGLGQHPSNQIFATGSLCNDPRLVLWSAEDARTIAILEHTHPEALGVCLLAFSESGKILASVGMDDDNTLVAHEWAKGSVIFRTPTEKGRGKVLCLCFLADGSTVPENLLQSLPPGTKASGVGGPPTRTGTAALGRGPVSSSFLLQSGSIVVTGGDKHLKFWWSQGQNIKSQRCIWGREKRQTITCVASASPMICVTGTRKGDILIWKDFKVQYRIGEGGRFDSPHKKSCIQTMWCRRDGNGAVNPVYMTGDAAGCVVIWEMVVDGPDMIPELKQLRRVRSDRSPVDDLVTLRTSELLPPPLIGSIQSLCARDGVLLIGTQSSDIYEVPFGIISPESATRRSPSTLGNTSGYFGEVYSGDVVVYSAKALHVVAGHMADIWGLATHPKKPIFFTSGDDSTVRIWSLDPHYEIMQKRISVRSRSLAVTIDGSHLAVGSTSGPILLYRILYGDDIEATHIAGVEQEIKDSAQMIQVIKFSPCGAVMAFACCDGCIYVRGFTAAEGKLDFSAGPLIVLRGHTGNVSHFDFGLTLLPNYMWDAATNKIREIDRGVLLTEKMSCEKPRDVTMTDLVIQSTDSFKELRYWNVSEGKEILSSMEVRDVVWCTLTCPLGWPVQGIYDPDEEQSEGNQNVVVSAVCRNNNWQKVPVVAAADSIGRLRIFNYPCVVPGSPDKCYTAHSGIISDLSFSYDDAYCISIGRNDRSIVVWKTDILDEIRERKALAIDQEADEQLSIDNLYRHNKRLMAAAGSAAASAGVYELGEFDIKIEEEDFEDIRDSKDVRPMGGDEFMATKPWIGAVREPSTWVDRPNMTDCPAESLELNFVYGYRGWDCRNNLSHSHCATEIVYHIAGAGIVYNIEKHSQIINTAHDDDISCLAVHPEGHIIATGQIGKRPKIVIWDSNTGVTLRELVFHKKGVNAICFSPSGRTLVSTGHDVDRTIVVHNIETGIVIGSGKIGKGISVLTLSISGNGMQMLTAGKNHVKFWDIPNPDAGRVELQSKAGILSKSCKTVVSSAYMGIDAVTGMSDGNIYLWKGRSIAKVQRAYPDAVPVTAMRSLNVFGGTEDTDPKLITGGKDGCIFVWNSQLVRQWNFDLKSAMPNLFHHQIQSVSSHSDMLVLGTKAGEIVEVNMISRDPALLVDSHFSDELWGLDVHPTKASFITCGDDMSVRKWDAKMKRQTEITSVGNKARALALSSDGFQLAVGLVDGIVKILHINDLAEIKTVKVARSVIQCMKYSPDLASLAVGSHDRDIYILETRNYSIRAICKGHHSYIKQLDFSADASKLQSVSGDYEILFWTAADGSQIKSATSVRDEKWATWTCTLGWPVQGIWPSGADGTDVNSVDRSPDCTIVASGDDSGKVKLFRYPCIKEGSKFLSCNGHSSHIPQVKFSSDGKWLFSVGGQDKAIMQFEVKKSRK